MSRAPTLAFVPPALLWPLLARALAYWIAVRAFLYFFWNHTLFREPPYAFAVLLTVCIAIRVDLRLTREEAFLDNLGVGVQRTLLVAALPVALLEVAGFVLGRVRGVVAVRDLFRAESWSFAPAGNPVLKSASVWLGEGSVTVLFGVNGAGKTAFLRAMLGLNRADTGCTHFAGQSLERPRLSWLARHGLFYLPDRELLPRTMRFGECIDAIESRFGAVPDRELILNRLNVTTLCDRRPGEISAGEQRRCEWALALLRRPVCLIADEPLLGAMPRDQELLVQILREEADRGAAILVTGHEVKRLSAIGDSFVWMSGGGTHVLGTREQAEEHPAFRREYLGRGDLRAS